MPTWAKVAAWLVPLTTLPSIIWRLTTILGFSTGRPDPCSDGNEGVGVTLYLFVGLPSLQLGLALLTLGLIRPWGEVFPRWFPGVGGRPVPVRFAVGVATTGALLVLLFGLAVPFENALDPIWRAFGAEPPRLNLPQGCEPPDWTVLRWYLPMVLWPPLLLAVTGHYWRRRTTPSTPERVDS